MDERRRLDPGERRVRVLLWLLALALTSGAAAYQRRTGPTYPLHGSYRHSMQEYEYRLIRSEVTSVDARVGTGYDNIVSLNLEALSAARCEVVACPSGRSDGSVPIVVNVPYDVRKAL